MKKDDIDLANAVDKAKEPEDNLIHLSTGVVLRGKMANPLTLVKVLSAFPRPKVPVHFVKEMGREVENPDDPDYIDRVQAWKTERSGSALNAMILLGTDLVSVPKKFSTPDGDDWMDEFALLGLPMNPESKSWRYLTWVMTKAAVTVEDLNKIQEVVGRLSGIPESKVEAAENFPGSDQASR